MCKTLALLCFSLVTLTNCAKISFNNGEETLNILGPELNGKEFNIRVLHLNISSYENSEKEIEKISDFDTLTNISIGYVDQKIFPRLTNLPKLKRVEIFGTNVTNITNDIFNNTTIVDLDLKNNQITTIQPNSFGPSILTLSLSCNQLIKFDPSWFSSPQFLKVLNLRGNQIKEIQENAFEGFSNLDDINFSYNKIVSIGSGAFANRNTFSWLFLHNNNISSLSENIFKTPVVIDNLYVHVNNLTYLSQAFMKGVTVTTRAPLKGNPWQCQCFFGIEDWAPKTTNTTSLMPYEGPHELRCISTFAYLQNCVEENPDEIIRNFWTYNTKIEITSQKDFCECSRKSNQCLF